jgi:hypothetical protein
VAVFGELGREGWPEARVSDSRLQSLAHFSALGRIPGHGRPDASVSAILGRRRGDLVLIHLANEFEIAIVVQHTASRSMAVTAKIRSATPGRRC